MTQERINKYFQGSIGSQCDTLFSTSDNRVFIRYEDAVFNIKEEGLTDDNILQWCRREVSSKAQDRPPQPHKTTPTNLIQNKPYNAR